jgi:hypothetical protein
VVTFASDATGNLGKQGNSVFGTPQECFSIWLVGGCLAARTRSTNCVTVSLERCWADTVPQFAGRYVIKCALCGQIVFIDGGSDVVIRGDSTW